MSTATLRSGVGITAVEPAVYVVPTAEPEADGTLAWDHTTVVTATVRAGSVEGFGFTYAAAAAADVVADLLAGVVRDRDVLDVTGAWEAMVRSVRNVGRPGIASMAIAAVDVALWDAKARLLDVALVELLGRVRPTVDAYASGGFTSEPEDRLAAGLARWAHDDGFPRVKMKIGTAWGSCPGRDVARVERARDAIGPDVELFVDANGAYTRKQAVRVGRRLEDLGVTWFEEPVSSDDLEGLHEIRGALGCDVAAGEYGDSVAYFHRLCDAGAVDVVQVDVTRCAGITEWLRIAALAAGRGLEVSGHCAPSLHVHPACSAPNVRHLEYFADHARIDRLLFDGAPTPDRGRLAPDPDRPGHGITLRRPDSEEFRR